MSELTRDQKMEKIRANVEVYLMKNAESCNVPITSLFVERNLRFALTAAVVDMRNAGCAFRRAISPWKYFVVAALRALVDHFSEFTSSLDL